MSYKIDEIEGIAKTNKKKLAKAGIKSTKDLLAKCATRKGRSDTAAATGCTDKQLLKWANLADLMRVKGVGRQFAELLEAAGVDTVKELKRRNAGNLAEAMAAANSKGKKKLSQVAPTEIRIQGWVAAAKKLKPAIRH